LRYIYSNFHEAFSFRAGDEDVGVDVKGQSEKLSLSSNVLKRFTGEAALHPHFERF